MLGHGWAEVEHDIIYKINSSFDTAPQDEMVLLDGAARWGQWYGPLFRITFRPVASALEETY